MRITGYVAHQVPSVSARARTINGSYDHSRYSWEGPQFKTIFIDRPQTPLPMAMALLLLEHGDPPYQHGQTLPIKKTPSLEPSCHSIEEKQVSNSGKNLTFKFHLCHL